jgi:hypothetical protein
MQDEISRRDWMKGALIASTLGLIARPSAAADLTPLEAADPTAKSLGFVTDASKVDASAHPTFKVGQRCAACAQYQGKPTDAKAACIIFAGRSVPAGGWCQVWTERSA